MARAPRVVAELGRPETADEAAARKAASSQAYRSSKTVRNLVAALLITVAVVAVVYFGVPRGTPPEPAPIDVAAAAEDVAASAGRPVVVPDVPEDWRANRAGLDGGVWTIVYAPESSTEFINVAQGFDTDDTWVSARLDGVAPTGQSVVDGITWDVYDLQRGNRDDNVTYALATRAAGDTVLVYGQFSPETAQTAAAALTDPIRDLEETR
ncbi:DUF4245 family protein [Microbacterium telephonicum]|uniref:Uncharacterized protein DUF4245 n=1 Tax=Microbacterium telephonicum TaxID=1714841 RepID=A0A498BZX2_9MICO|nr:DUF4245 family protein [Microbacterium telephonicum]RLK49025.1 uncharacterized protein DUF4245 [Microbacterium telephonicum]